MCFRVEFYFHSKGAMIIVQCTESAHTVVRKQNANQDEIQQLKLIYQLMRLLSKNRDLSGSPAGSKNNEQHCIIIVIGTLLRCPVGL